MAERVVEGKGLAQGVKKQETQADWLNRNAPRVLELFGLTEKFGESGFRSIYVDEARFWQRLMPKGISDTETSSYKQFFLLLAFAAIENPGMAADAKRVYGALKGKNPFKMAELVLGDVELQQCIWNILKFLLDTEREKRIPINMTDSFVEYLKSAIGMLSFADSGVGREIRDKYYEGGKLKPSVEKTFERMKSGKLLDFSIRVTGKRMELVVQREVAKVGEIPVNAVLSGGEGGLNVSLFVDKDIPLKADQELSVKAGWAPFQRDEFFVGAFWKAKQW